MKICSESLLLIMAYLAQSVMADCSIPPIYVNMHQRKVSGKLDPQYGSSVGIGTPARNQSIWPSLRQNETTFSTRINCEDFTTSSNCITSRFSIDPRNSTTWKPSLSNTNSSKIISGEDTFHLYTHFSEYREPIALSITDTPVQFEISGSSKTGTLGLGYNSTILSKLYSTGAIASKTFSLYVGAQNDDDDEDTLSEGSNIFGGYDADRFSGAPHTYPMDLSSPDYLPVTVSDIILDHPKNVLHQRLSIMSNDPPFVAKLTTDQYTMLLPSSIMSRFIKIVNAIPIPVPNNSTNPSVNPSLNKSNSNSNSTFPEPSPTRLLHPFENGSLTIVINSTFHIHLPSSVITSRTFLSSLTLPPPDYTGPYYLSTAFLTRLYLMLDFPAQKFHIAPAILPSTQANASALPSPQPWCSGTTPWGRAAPAHRDSDSQVDHRREQATSHANRTRKLVGGIVGGVVGSMVLVMVALALLCVHRRRQARSRKHRAQRRAEKASVRTVAEDGTGVSGHGMVEGHGGQYGNGYGYAQDGLDGRDGRDQQDGLDGFPRLDESPTSSESARLGQVSRGRVGVGMAVPLAMAGSAAIVSVPTSGERDDYRSVSPVQEEYIAQSSQPGPVSEASSSTAVPPHWAGSR